MDLAVCVKSMHNINSLSCICLCVSCWALTFESLDLHFWYAGNALTYISDMQESLDLHFWYAGTHTLYRSRPNIKVKVTHTWVVCLLLIGNSQQTTKVNNVT